MNLTDDNTMVVLTAQHNYIEFVHVLEIFMCVYLEQQCYLASPKDTSYRQV